MLILKINFVSVDPASCESDEDCSKGKAKCISGKCQCIAKNDYGDGKTKCTGKYKIFHTICFPLYSV